MLGALKCCSGFWNVRCIGSVLSIIQFSIFLFSAMNCLEVFVTIQICISWITLNHTDFKFNAGVVGGGGLQSLILIHSYIFLNVLCVPANVFSGCRYSFVNCALKFFHVLTNVLCA